MSRNGSGRYRLSKWVAIGLSAICLLALSQTSLAATISFNFQDQWNDGGPASNYDLPADFSGTPTISIEGTLASPLEVDFGGIDVSNYSDEVPGYFEGNAFNTALYGDSSVSASTITFSEPVTDVSFNISAFGTPQSEYESTSIVGYLNGQPEFVYAYPALDSDTQGDWYLVNGGSASVDMIVFNDFQLMPLGNLEVSIPGAGVPEPAAGWLLLALPLVVLRRLGARERRYRHAAP